MAHTIKAYLSDRSGRDCAVPFATDYNTYVSDRALEEEMAVAEAARILADVEQPESTRAFNVPLWDAENDGTLGGAMDILAESLAAFVADGAGL